MIEGLAYMPWLALRRQREGASGRSLFDCTACKKTNPTDASRAPLGCGFVPLRLRRPPPKDTHIGESVLPPSVCPGYTLSLPAVVHAQRAAHWSRTGQLSLFVPDPGPMLMEAIEIYESARIEVEAYALRTPGQGG